MRLICDTFTARNGDYAPDCRGAAVAVIAERLQISPKTVNSYRYRMFSKLNIRSDVELTHIAISYGLIAIERVYQSGGSI